MPELNNQFPEWLAQRYATRGGESAPWLDSAIRTSMQREEMRQKMPLQLQQMALRNKATQLEIENQGMQNDVINEQQQLYREQFPVVRDWMTSTARKPIAEQLNDPGPAVTHPGLQKTILEYKQQLANTMLAKTMMEDQIQATRDATKLRMAGIDPTPARGTDGTWDSSMLSDLGLKFTEDTNIRAANLRKAGSAWRYDEQGNLIQGSSNADIVLVEFEGNKFLKNTKTGALHPIDKRESKKSFIAKHIGSWMKDNDLTSDEASRSMSEFYDKNLSDEEPGKPAVKTTVRVQKPDGTIGSIPASRLDEAIKAGWKKVE